jgi:hypothetical protein
MLPRYERGDCLRLLAMPVEMVLVPIVGTTIDSFKHISRMKSWHEICIYLLQPGAGQ